ncbi:phosphodiesterase [Aquibium carbonis]|uniref:Phosphodiesterase n=1 Tax=Aquibium carbonis TaxID=2495581 RepID=A0A3S0AAA2_9HYPH|nr:metallophosphoesterase [Aquibium carbonis]RST87141.1 phosphodiesterase [Aquibium carbonis]
MPKSPTFIHLTDLHAHCEGKVDGIDTIGNLDAALAMIAAIDPAPDFVVVSGDLTDKGDASSYRAVRERLDTLHMPVLCALGNHDARPGFYQGMLDRTSDLDAPYFHDRVFDGVHVIVLDTSVPGKVSGALGDDQFAFLGAALQRHPELPRIVVMHHGPRIVTESPFAWESLNEAETERLRRALAGHRVAGIITGHIHHDGVSSWHGIPVVVGNGLHDFIDPTYRKGLKIHTGASFGQCTLRDTGLSVAFVPLPSDRRHLVTLDAEKVRRFE